MKFTYKPEGVCSQLFEIEVNNEIIESIKVMGGCNGNLQGISKLLVGMSIDEAINRLEGIKCGYKNTSCPDQISKALKSCK